MLPITTKTCDICNKKFSLTTSFTHLSIEWSNGGHGRYSNHSMCDACYRQMSNEFNRAIHKVKFDMRHYAAQETGSALNE